MHDNVLKNIYYQDFLKKRIEKKFGKQVKYSKDCKHLSDQIYHETNRQLSVSTVKRFFQLIASPFKPSRYTLDTFSIYLGYKNWESFTMSVNKDEKGKSAENKLERLKKNVLQISESSYYSLSRKTRYNSDTFIRRTFAENFIKKFIDSGKTATILIAPTGFGKSTILLQWYNTYFSDEDLQFKKDIICLIDGGLFFTFYNQTEENEILCQLLDFDFHKSYNLFLNQYAGNSKARFILIIDDLDRVFSVREKYHLFAENIMRIIMLNKHNPLFKVILTCRPENLDILTSVINPNPLLSESFFSVNFAHKNHLEAINIPLFSPAEIQKALENNNSNIYFHYLSLYYSDTFNVINTPLFFSFFIHDEDYSVTEFTEVGFLNHLIQRFYFSAPFAEEKQLLIHKFLHLVNIEDQVSFVDKDRLLAGSDSRLIYQELIKAGLIYEYIDSSGNPGVHLKVRFSNKIIFEYLLTRTLINENSDSFVLLNSVFEKYKNNIPTQNALLKWLVKIAFFDGNLEFIKQLHSLLELQVNVLNELANESMPGSLRSIQNAFFEGLRSHKQLSHELMPWLVKSRLGQKLYFEEYFDMDNLMHIPEKSIELYIQGNNTPDGQMIGGYILFAKAFYALDFERCSSEFEKISRINSLELRTPLGVGYYFSSWFLYASLSGYKKKREMLKRFLLYSGKSILKRSRTFRFIPPYEFFVVYSLNVCDLFDEVRFAVENMEDDYNVSGNHPSCFFQYYKLIYARSLLHTGEPERAEELFSQVTISDFPRHIRHLMNLNVNLSLFDFLVHQKRTAEALNILNETRLLAREMGYSFFIQKTETLELNLVKAKKDIPK